MTVRPPIRKPSRNSSASSRKNCRRKPRRRARSWKASRARRRLHRRLRPVLRRKRNNRQHTYTRKGAARAAPFLRSASSVYLRVTRPVVTAVVAYKSLCNVRMTDRLPGRVRQQVLLGDVGDVFSLGVFSEQVIERLILVRAYFRRDRLQPFLGVVEHGIDIKDHSTER